jgi:hypothetical protein
LEDTVRPQGGTTALDALRGAMPLAERLSAERAVVRRDWGAVTQLSVLQSSICLDTRTLGSYNRRPLSLGVGFGYINGLML